MKKIECFVREDKLAELIQALKAVGVGGVTVSRVAGFGRQYRESGGRLRPKVKIEILAMTMEVDDVLQVLASVARTGAIGDGKIAVLPVDDVIRVRTGETGAKALA
ncbi:MAG: P-II family nitrogen regulator [Elusimicrobia bacterium]|nr:P-II family nitrogen regulator [Elusimicrobiota bacterium]